MSAKKSWRLTTAFVSSVTRPGRYGDRRGGHGLTLRVKPTQRGGWSKTWSQRIRINGKPFQPGLGSYPVVTLARAREKALDNARRVERGEDISKPQTPVPTVHEAFDLVIANRSPKWTGENTLSNWLRSKRVFDEIGSTPVSAVKSRQVQDIIGGILHQNQNKAYKARSHLSTVMKWAMVQEYRSTNPAPPDITNVFGRPSPAVHHRTMLYKDLGEALAKVRDAENIWWANRLALIFLALTGVRSKNVRLATWAEIDIPNACWTLSSTRMKARKAHQVPLSRQALQVLAYAKLLGSGTDLIFPPERAHHIQSSNLAKLTTKLNITSSPHGFRQCITNWARGSRKRYAKGAVEMLIAHVPSKASREAYETDDFYDLRVPIMQDWADFISKTMGSIIPPIKRGPAEKVLAHTPPNVERTSLNDDFIEPRCPTIQESDDSLSQTMDPATPAHQQPSPTYETKPKSRAKKDSQKGGKSKAARKDLSKPTRESPTDATRLPEKSNRQKADRLTTEESRRRNLEHNAAKRLRMKAAGLCLDCRAASRPGKTRCQNCADNKQLEDKQRRRAKNPEIAADYLTETMGPVISPMDK